MIKISDRSEYDLIKSRGFEPLIDWVKFDLEFTLRVTIQRELFGEVGFLQQNDRFYHWVWNNKIHCCENCGKPLHNYSAVYISHIISKGADRRIATDPRNANILCYDHHSVWEYGTKTEKQKLNIYRENQLIINLLKKDYNIG